jgi:hypothetical protein
MGMVVVVGHDVLGDRYVRDFLQRGSLHTLYRYRITWSREILGQLEARWREAGRGEDFIAKSVDSLNKSITYELAEPGPRLAKELAAEPCGTLLAAAVAAGAQLIITANSDTVPSRCQQYGIKVQSPDDFGSYLAHAYTREMRIVVGEMAACLGQEVAKTMSELAVALPNAIATLRGVNAGLAPSA